MSPRPAVKPPLSPAAIDVLVRAKIEAEKVVVAAARAGDLTSAETFEMLKRCIHLLMT